MQMLLIYKWLSAQWLVFDPYGMVSYSCQPPPYTGVTPFPSTGPVGSARATMMCTCPCLCTCAGGQEACAQVTPRPRLLLQQRHFICHVVRLLGLCWHHLPHLCHRMLLAWLRCWTNMQWLECSVLAYFSSSLVCPPPSSLWNFLLSC